MYFKYFKMSLSLIKITNESWNLVDDNIPQLDDDIPVISCMGTSRDGKSTLLNLYSNYLEPVQKKPLFSWSQQKISMPFVSSSGDDVVTNGIDYTIIPKKCMLVDCQGLQLDNAKFDQHSMILTYLVSNIVIFHVRQILDLQVLNNCLPMFGFLCEIPEEFKRKDKPILLIRIKDYQNIKILKEKENYLDEYVEKWLQKTNDQYAEIKDAIKKAFDIKIIATAYPKTKNDEVDINDPNFLCDNPSFLNACETIKQLSQNQKTPNILKNKELIRQLVNSLQKNKNIDCMELDQYSIKSERDVRRYIQDNLQKEQFKDFSIEKMDGSLEASELCRKMKNLIDEHKEIIAEKFREAPEKSKELFNDVFNKLDKDVVDFKEENKKNAYIIIDKYYNFFNKMFYIQKTPPKGKVLKLPFEYVSTKIMENFNKEKDALVTELDKIDTDIKNKIMEEISFEEIAISEKQEEIFKLMRDQEEQVKNKIKSYNLKPKIEQLILEKLEKSINDQDYNLDINNVLEKYTNTIKNKLFDSVSTMNKIWYITKDKQVKEHDTYKSDIDIESFIDSELSLELKDELTRFYWDKKINIFTPLHI